MLITRSDFAPYIEVAANLKDAKLNPRITEAEDFDLCGLMGTALYYDMAQYVTDGVVDSDAPQQYKDLINGVTYGANIVFKGIKPVSVYFSGARLIRSLDLHITPDAMAYKRNEFSDHASDRQIGQRATEYENIAIAYWAKCVQFIEFSGRTLFPLYNGFAHCGSATMSGRQRIIGVHGRGMGGYGYGR